MGEAGENADARADDDDVADNPADDIVVTPPKKTRGEPLKRGTVLKPLRKAPAKPVRQRDLVWYVEDEQQNWEVAELLLKKNYDLVHAPDDQQACEIFRTKGKQ